MNQYLRRKIWTLNRSGKFRGYLRTVSGYPVTLTDCMAGQPVSLAVDGNAVQDGTPTPDNPVDVQLCGDRTVNLLDVDLVFSGSINNSSIRYTELYIEPNKVYTLLTNVPKATASIFDVFIKGGSDPSFSSSKHGASDGFPRSATTGDDGCLLVGIRDSLSQNDFHDGTYIIMLIEGAYTAETMPAYEPYGYKVPLTMTGMNLLSNNENDWVINAGIYKYFTIPVEGTTTLQAKIKEGKSIPKGLYLGYSKNGMDATGGVTWLIDNGIFNGAPIRTSELKYISIHPKTALLDEIFDSLDIMLIEGAYTTETMPAYEPYRELQTFNIYTPQQLAKVGDTADTVVLDFDNKTAELRKNVGSMVVSDGYSGATSAANTLLVRFYHVTKPARKVSANANVIDIAADIFEAETFNNLGSAFTSKQYAISGNVFTPVFNVTVPKTAIGGDTNELMNAWAAEHPATVYYPIATPITTDITALQDWDAMPPLWSGTAAITADTVIAPSAITAKYYASKPEEVN